MDFTIEFQPRNSSPSHGFVTFLLVFTLFLAVPPLTVAQTNTDTKNNENEIFSPSMMVIIVVVAVAVFFMVVFLVFVRQCSSLQAEGGAIRNFAERSTSASARGLDASVISSFPTFLYSEVAALKKGREPLECAVCLNEFDEEMLRLIPQCDHVFHPECIDAWFESHTTCPVCRANLETNSGYSEAQLIESTNETEVENLVVPGDNQISDDSPAPEMLSGKRTRSLRSGRLRWFYPRSHSTGHCLVEPGENTARFTLKLPVEVRKQIMNRQLLRATSAVVLPREGSSRRGKSSRRLDWPEMSKSNRWVFSVNPPFFTRMPSMKTATVETDGGGI